MRLRDWTASVLVLVVCLTAGGAATAATELFTEDFESWTLGESLAVAALGFDPSAVWTNVGPTGWTTDNSGVPAGDVTEWRGWAFADVNWWISVAGNQDRDMFTSAVDFAMIADGDEYDDIGHDPGLMNTLITTAPFDISAATAGTLQLNLDSSFYPYDLQTGVIEVSYDGGATFAEVITLNTDNSGGNSSLSRINEALSLPLSNPAGATQAQLRFGYLNAGNDW